MREKASLRGLSPAIYTMLGDVRLMPYQTYAIRDACLLQKQLQFEQEVPKRQASLSVIGLFGDVANIISEYESEEFYRTKSCNEQLILQFSLSEEFTKEIAPFKMKIFEETLLAKTIFKPKAQDESSAIKDGDRMEMSF